MKRYILILMILCFYTQGTYSQTITTEYIQKHTSYFTIENGKILGKGKKVIKDLINSSQFVTYGEAHNSKQISKLVEAMMPFFKKSGFHHFAIEVGPNSAKKLAELSTPPSKTIEQLRAFNTKYTVAQGDQVAEPIPFFSGVEDAKFLQAARTNGMNLWGLDQEFYYAPFFLMDEIINTIKNKNDYQKINQLKLQAQQVMYQHYVAEAQGKIEDPFSLFKKEKAVQNFFNAFDPTNQKAQAIISDLKFSWDVYTRWRDDSHVDRISYMRNNFIKHYQKALQTEKTPKVFTKIGGLHAHRLFSNGAFDIGNLKKELAEKNGTVSTTINTWTPFSKTEKGIVNNLEKFKRSYSRYSIMTKLAKENQFTIIDLRKIRNDLSKGKIALPINGDYHKLKRLILGYDYVIMLPADEDVTPNRNH